MPNTPVPPVDLYDPLAYGPMVQHVTVWFDGTAWFGLVDLEREPDETCSTIEFEADSLEDLLAAISEEWS